MEFENPPPTGIIEFDTWANRLVEMLRTQPAFLAFPSSDQEDFAIDEWVEVVWGNEIYDLGDDFASNTFTAPVDGKYQLTTAIRMNNLDVVASMQYQVRINTSNRNYLSRCDFSQFNADLSVWTFPLNCLADMDAGDTATVEVYQVGGTAQTDIDTVSFFCGALIR